MIMKLPSPREKLAGCVWLPRILAKARLFQAGRLPQDYAANLCSPGKTDSFFMAHFELSREDVLAAAAWPDEKVSEWFSSRNSAERIEQWNKTAVNLGRTGYPLAERLPVALATVYKNVAHLKPATIFEVLEADEREA
jgi:hypothetical protein